MRKLYVGFVPHPFWCTAVHGPEPTRPELSGSEPAGAEPAACVLPAAPGGGLPEVLEIVAT